MAATKIVKIVVQDNALRTYRHSTQSKNL